MRRTPRLDLGAQRRALAIRHRWDQRRRGSAAGSDGVDARYSGKAAQRQIARDHLHVVIAVRRARQEARRVGGEHRCQRPRHHIGELVVLDAVPGIEDEHTAGAQHAPRLRTSACLVGEEHDAELADDDVERCLVERQLQRVGRLPLHGMRRAGCGRAVEHRLVQIGGDDLARRRQPPCQRARDDAGAGRGFEHVHRLARSDTARQIFGIRLEDQRHEQGVVDLGDRAGENGVAGGHGLSFAPCELAGKTTRWLGRASLVLQSKLSQRRGVCQRSFWRSAASGNKCST
jgi:hypothetical protein